MEIADVSPSTSLKKFEEELNRCLTDQKRAIKDWENVINSQEHAGAILEIMKPSQGRRT